VAKAANSERKGGKEREPRRKKKIANCTEAIAEGFSWKMELERNSNGGEEEDRGGKILHSGQEVF